MELTKLYKTIIKNKNTLLLYVLVGAIAGIGVYFLPAKYYSSGAFFVKRSVDNSQSYFTYEGYYAQQSAASFTNTVAALLESEEVQSEALQNLGQHVNETSLKRFSRFVRVTKISPQLVQLTVKGNTESESLAGWNALSSVLLNTSEKVNASGDYKLGVSLVSDTPVVTKTYKSLAINIPLGVISGIALGVFIISLKEYDK